VHPRLVRRAPGLCGGSSPPLETLGAGAARSCES